MYLIRDQVDEGASVTPLVQYTWGGEQGMGGSRVAEMPKVQSTGAETRLD